MTNLITSYKSSNTIKLDRSSIKDIHVYFNNMIDYAIRKYEQHIKDIELDYSTRIQKTEYGNGNGIDYVVIDYILSVDIYPNEKKYYNLNHLKIKKPDIIEIVSDHTGNRRFLTDRIVEFTGVDRLSFSTNMGFFPDAWFTEMMTQK